MIITVLNFSFFNYIYQNSNFIFTAIIFIVFFTILLFVFTILFIPFLTKILAILLLFCGTVCVYFMQSYNIVIDEIIVASVINTDFTEIKSFLNFKITLFIIFILLICVFISKIKINYRNLKVEIIAKIKILGICTVIIAIFAVWISLSKDTKNFFKANREIRMLNVPFYPIYSTIKYAQKLYLVKSKNFKILDNSPKFTNNNKNLLIFIVGESERSANFSANGYTENDTNFYSKTQKNLISFTNFYACAASTMISVPCMFSDLPRKDFDINTAKYRQNLFGILQKAGVKIFWFEKNGHDCKGACNQIDARNVKIISKTPFNKVSYYDDDVFDMAKTKIAELNDGENAMIILHIRGSHGALYNQNYPLKFKKFTPTCDTNELKNCTYEQISNSYDNSIVYTDFLINDLINFIKKNSSFTQNALFFVSDHGESLGENGFYMHGLPFEKAPIFQTHIGAMFYISDDSKASKLNALKDKKFSHDNIFHTVLGYFGIQSTVYNKKMDILAF